MAPISTILWDTGGVLLTNGWDHNERKTVFDQFAIPPEVRDAFEARHAVENDAWEKGLIDFDEYLRRTLFFEPRPYTPEQVRQAIENESKFIPDTAMPLLSELFGRGQVRMGQLNNESRELNDMRLDRFGLRQYWSVFFCSAYVHLRKPEPEIYKLALEVLQAPAGEVLFIDDREKQVEAARSLGMDAVQYTGSAALRAELEQRELL